MREGDASDEMLKKVQTAFDHLFGVGRAFNNKDMEKLRQLNADDSAQRKPGAADRASGPDGRVRGELSSGTTVKSSVSRSGELKEDEIGKATEKGRVKIAPEYQKALQDYYKKVSQ